MVHLYIGNGKGKTTAAVGMALRAKGAGKNVCFVQFLKGSCVSSEIKMLERLGIKVIRLPQRHPAFYKNISVASLRKKISKDLEKVKLIICSRKSNVVILDEILTALDNGFANEKQILNIIKSNAKASELILTGLSSTKAISRLSDYISCIKKVKHPFDRAVKARKGIEL